jgi:hypothetical protein
MALKVPAGERTTMGEANRRSLRPQRAQRAARTPKALARPDNLEGTGMSCFLESLWFALRAVVGWTASVVSSMIVRSAATGLSYAVMRIIFGHG